MDMVRRLLLALLVTSVAAPMPTSAFVFADNEDNKMVCRRDRDRTLGFNIRAPRTCRTRAEWRALEEHTQNEMQQIRDGQEVREPEGGFLRDLPGSGPN
jgi:Ni/Co efflux regulator RcnB